MAIKFNPFTSNFDFVGNGAGTSEDSFNYYNIISSFSKIVPINTEHFVTESITVDGTISVIGRLTVWSAEELIEDAYNYYNITTNHNKTIPINTESLITKDLTLAGTVSVIGTFTILNLNDLRKSRVRTVTGLSIAVSSYDEVVFVDASLNNVTLNLPQASTVANKSYSFKSIDSTNTITVDAFGSETIDGNTTKVLALYNSLSIISNGAEWFII